MITFLRGLVHHAPSAWFDRTFPRSSADEGLCTACGHRAVPAWTRPGRDDLELALWLCFVGSTAGYLAFNIINAVARLIPGFVIHLVTTLLKLFLLVGVVYTLWRLSTQSLACTACGGNEIVPPDSPRGKKLARDLAE